MKIGYLDYRLTNYHYKKFFGILNGPVGAGEVTVAMAHELEPSDEGKAWSAENKVQLAATAEEVIAGCDAIMVLAPNNPEKHLELARPALKSGKPVFIDKMLAQSPEDAREIVRLAGEGGTPIMSASGLRFAVELDELDKEIDGPVTAFFARGMGKFPIYAVHTISMATRYLGGGARRVIDTGQADARAITVDTGQLRATLEVRDSENQYDTTPWQVGVKTSGKYHIATIKNFDGFYENCMRKAIEFFKSGNSPISTDEQIAIVEIQAAAEKSFAAGGNWV